MVTPALREVMVAAAGAGRLAGTDVVTAAASHPTCGDRLEVDCRLDGGRIRELAWRAEGCPATLAVAAVAASALPGIELSGAGARMRQRLGELGGLSATEGHALELLLRTLARLATS